jgi:hypothetical protein
MLNIQELFHCFFLREICLLIEYNGLENSNLEKGDKVESNGKNVESGLRLHNKC